MITNLNEFKRQEHVSLFLKENAHLMCEGETKTTELGILIKFLFNYFNLHNYDINPEANQLSKSKYVLKVTKTNDIELDKNLIINCNLYIKKYGYFISSITYAYKNMQYHHLSFEEFKKLQIDSELYSIDVEIEARYHENISHFDTVYHVTNELNWSKIKRIGLVPKNHNKLTEHPERIYVCSTLLYAEEIKNRIIDNIKINFDENKLHKIRSWNIDSKGRKLNPNLNFIILKIDNVNNVDFYEDPNFISFDTFEGIQAKGFYTYSNIGKNNITFFNI